MGIEISSHFSYRKLMRFVFPSIAGYRTFRVGFNADGASVYRASLAFIFFEKIYKGGQNVLVKSLKTLANTGEIGFYFFIRT